MIGTLPTGVVIGTMQAPLSWIFSHTSRFVGIVRITIQDGNGVILIEKGVPKFFYFEHGSRTLKGNAAREYFSARPLLDFSLNKLTAEEFSLALARADPEAAAAAAAAGTQNAPFEAAPGDAGAAQEPPVPRPEPAAPPGERPKVVVVPHGKNAETPPARPPAAPAGDGGLVLERPVSIPPTWEPAGRKTEKPDEIEKEFDIFEDRETAPALTEERLMAGAPAKKTAPPAAQTPQPQKPPVQTAPPASPPAAEPGGWDAGGPDEIITDEDFRIIAQVLLGRIKTIPGVIAVMVFNKDMHLLSIGDVNLDRLVSSAEDMLMTVSQLDSIMEWGSFVSMTLQVPSGNVIVAPFFEEYLCILTSPEINLGRIRRLLREIKSQQGR